MKKVLITLAAVSALSIALIGADTFACGGKQKTASAAGATGSCCAGAMGASSGSCSATAKTVKAGGCESSCSSTKTAEMTSGGQCSSSATDWTATVCGSKGYYAANVYATCHGREYAILGDKSFEVTETTPFIQEGRARYYFPTEEARQAFAKDVRDNAGLIEQETVSLATADGNVVSMNDSGQKIAQCPVTGKTFVVTADSKVKVVDGKRYYLNGGTELSTVSDRIHQ
jgi:hypothetical protein